MRDEAILTPLGVIPLELPGAGGFGLSPDREMLVYSVGEETPTAIQRLSSGGEKPWGLGLSPCGGWMLVADQGSDTVTSFRVDPETGKLHPHAALSIRQPTSATFASI